MHLRAEQSASNEIRIYTTFSSNSFLHATILLWLYKMMNLFKVFFQRFQKNHFRTSVLQIINNWVLPTKPQLVMITSFWSIKKLREKTFETVKKSPIYFSFSISSISRTLLSFLCLFLSYFSSYFHYHIGCCYCWLLIIVLLQLSLSNTQWARTVRRLWHFFSFL